MGPKKDAGKKGDAKGGGAKGKNAGGGKGQGDEKEKAAPKGGTAVKVMRMHCIKIYNRTAVDEMSFRMELYFECTLHEI